MSLDAACSAGKAVRRLGVASSGRSAVLIAALGMLCGCETLDPRAPMPTAAGAPQMPTLYKNRAAEGLPSAAKETRAEGDWWQRYGSEELDRLVARALADNPDLRIAALRIDQVGIRADQASAGRLPTLTMPIRTGATNAGGVTDAQQSSQFALLGTWRLDVWGEQRGLIESAQLQVWRAIHERENIQRILIAHLVSNYIAYLGITDALELAREHEGIARSILRTIEQRLALGDATADEREVQQMAVHLQQASLPGLLRQREALAIAISRLLGTTPERLNLSDKGLDELTVPGITAGLPSALLLRRPDVRMMEARLRAANADIAVARARMLPPIDLGAQAGFSGLTLSQMLQPQSFLLNTLASLAVTIFDGGRRAGNQAIAQSVYEEMTAVYGQTVLEAIREVEMALVSMQATGQQMEAQRKVTRSALQRLRIAHEAYAAGSVELTGMLEARKNYQRSLEELQRLKAERLNAFAALALSLGEGTAVKADVAGLRLSAVAGD